MTPWVSAQVFGARVQHCRLRLGWSSRDAAPRMGIARATLSALEGGRLRLWQRYAAQIAEAFEMPLETLVETDERTWVTAATAWHAAQVAAEQAQAVEQALQRTCQELLALLATRLCLGALPLRHDGGEVLVASGDD